MQRATRYFEDVQIGEELPVLQKNINLARMMAYGAATWDFIRIHYDADYVREQGLTVRSWTGKCWADIWLSTFRTGLAPTRSCES